MEWDVTLRLHDEEQTVIRMAVKAPNEAEAMAQALLKWDHASILKVEPFYRS